IGREVERPVGGRHESNPPVGGLRDGLERRAVATCDQHAAAVEGEMLGSLPAGIVCRSRPSRAEYTDTTRADADVTQTVRPPGAKPRSCETTAGGKRPPTRGLRACEVSRRTIVDASSPSATQSLPVPGAYAT